MHFIQRESLKCGGAPFGARILAGRTRATPAALASILFTYYLVPVFRQFAVCAHRKLWSPLFQDSERVRRSHLRKMRGGAVKSARLVDALPSWFCFLSLASSSECNLHALAVPQAET